MREMVVSLISREMATDQDLTQCPILIARLLMDKTPTLITEDGYQMHLLEFLAEQPLEYLQKIMKALTIYDYQGDITTALDFFYLLLQWPAPSRATDLSSYNYQEILDLGRAYLPFHRTSCIVCQLLAALYTNNPYYRERPVCGKVQDDLVPPLEPVDMVRVALYQRAKCFKVSDAKYPTLSWLASTRFSEPEGQNEVYYDRLSEYVVGYRVPPREEVKNRIIDTLNTFFPTVLTHLIYGYLWSSPLFKWAHDLGMNFPLHIKTEAQRFRYYFDHVGEYRFDSN